MLSVTSCLICLHNNKTDCYFYLNSIYKKSHFWVILLFLTLFYVQHYKLIGYKKLPLYIKKKINIKKNQLNYMLYELLVLDAVQHFNYFNSLNSPVIV